MEEVTNIKNIEFRNENNLSTIDIETGQSILDTLVEYKKNNILDLGTGTTTKICVYYKNHYNRKCKITTVDNNERYLKSFKLPKSVNKVICTLYVDDEKSYYIDINDYIKDNYDLIIVDGPVGYMSKLPRTNILNIVYENRLSNNAHIIIHDTNRPGEKLLISQLIGILDNQNKKYEINKFNLHSVIKIY